MMLPAPPGPGTIPSKDPDRVRAAVEEVFADPAYHEILVPVVVPEGAFEALKQIFTSVTNFFSSIQEWTYNLFLESPVLFGLLMSGILAVLFLITFHIVYTVRMTIASIRGTGDPTDEAEQDERRAIYRELLEEADRLAKSGDYAEGIRTLLLALFAMVGERRPGLVLHGWTNHEFVDRIPIDDRGRSRLRDLASAVDRVWYGRERATEADYGDAASIVESVVRS